MEKYGVSKPTIREAWRVLESEGLINVRRGALGGAVVQTPSSTAASRQVRLFLERRRSTLADVHGARDFIECSVVSDLADSTRSRSGLVALHKLAAAEEVAPSDLSGCAAGSGFHQALLAASGNKTMMLYHSLIAPIVDQHLARFGVGTGAERLAGLPTNARVIHAALVRLIESGDTVLARDFWHEHLVAVVGVVSDVRLTAIADLAEA